MQITGCLRERYLGNEQHGKHVQLLAKLNL